MLMPSRLRRAINLIHRRPWSRLRLATGLGPTLPADAAFVLVWVASGLLVCQASLEAAPEA
ncbi:MAG TPA: hypothetical protein VNN07_14750 [Candidatus Tectomicrobia bacterium]|nr:hypothetical protein [Candidatus Tectomicrobia bacterium]